MKSASVALGARNASICLMIQAIEPAVADLLKGLPRELDNESDRARLVPALQFALTTYGDERRPSGETYVEHGRNVVGALSELGIVDTDTVIATPVSYTHLDVYKRQPRYSANQHHGRQQ